MSDRREVVKAVLIAAGSVLAAELVKWGVEEGKRRVNDRRERRSDADRRATGKDGSPA